MSAKKKAARFAAVISSRWNYLGSFLCSYIPFSLFSSLPTVLKKKNQVAVN